MASETLSQALFIRPITLQRSAHIALQQQAQIPHDDVRVLFHPLADPVQHQPHKRVLVKVRDKDFVLLPHLQTCRFFLHDRDQKVIGHLIEELLNLLPADPLCSPFPSIYVPEIIDVLLFIYSTFCLRIYTVSVLSSRSACRFHHKHEPVLYSSTSCLSFRQC